MTDTPPLSHYHPLSEPCAASSIMRDGTTSKATIPISVGDTGFCRMRSSARTSPISKPTPAENHMSELCTLGLLRIPSVTLSAFFAPQDCSLHSWETFSPLFVSRRCCLAFIGDIIFPLSLLEGYSACARRLVPHFWDAYTPLFVPTGCVGLFVPVRANQP